MNAWVMLVLAIFATTGFFLWRLGKTGRIRGLIARILGRFAPNSDDIVRRLKQETDRERNEAARLQTVLVAKQELMAAKAANIRLRRRIKRVSEKNLNG